MNTRKATVAAIVSLLAMAGMPVQADKNDTGDVLVQGASIDSGTPDVVARGLAGGAGASLTNPYSGLAGVAQSGGNTGGAMSAAFGGTGASSTPQVPEPGTIILGGLGMLMLLASRRAGRRGR